MYLKETISNWCITKMGYAMTEYNKLTIESLLEFFPYYVQFCNRMRHDVIKLRDLSSFASEDIYPDSFINLFVSYAEDNKYFNNYFIIATLLYKYEIKTVLEVGVADGMGLLNIILASKYYNKSILTYHGIDFNKNSAINIGKINQHFRDIEIKFYNENSANVLPKLNPEYDLIILDGQHGVGVLEELEQAIRLKPKIIIIDDTHLPGIEDRLKHKYIDCLFLFDESIRSDIPGFFSKNVAVLTFDGTESKHFEKRVTMDRCKEFIPEYKLRAEQIASAVSEIYTLLNLKGIPPYREKFIKQFIDYTSDGQYYTNLFLITHLVKNNKIRSVLEIGLADGMGLLNIILSSEIYGNRLDKITCVDIDPIARINFDKIAAAFPDIAIELIIADSDQVLRNLHGLYDLVIIDDRHVKEKVHQELPLVGKFKPKFIVIDDTQFLSIELFLKNEFGDDVFCFDDEVHNEISGFLPKGTSVISCTEGCLSDRTLDKMWQHSRLKVAFVKQCYDVFGPWSSYRFSETGIEQSIKYWPYKSTLWEMTHLLSADWYVTDLVEETWYVKNAMFYEKNRKNIFDKHCRNITPLNAIPFDDYDVVISLDPFIRKRDVNCILAYYMNEHCDPSYEPSLISPIHGYDLYLDHMMSLPLDFKQIPSSISFPFMRDPAMLRALVCGAKEEAVWIDCRTILWLAGNKALWDKDCDELVKKLQCQFRIPVKYRNDIFKTYWKLDDPPAWGDFILYMKEMASCKYYISLSSCGGGQGLCDAAALGLICLGTRTKPFHSMICDPALLCTNLDDAAIKLTNLYKSVDYQIEILSWQDYCLEYFFKKLPYEVLLNAVALKRITTANK